MMMLTLRWTSVLLAASLAGQTQDFRELMKTSPRLALHESDLKVGAKLEMVSSVAVDNSGMIYLLQRGSGADPVIVVDREGRILRSWGAGMYKIPHSIRIDPRGAVWTTDAATSVVYKFTPLGKLLLKIEVGGLPEKPKSEFCGTTDIAFGPDGRIFIADGYANARILEYTSAGKRVREWGAPGDGPGEFRLPHALAVGHNHAQNILYVADRENGRIQRFTLEGHYLGEWNRLGKTFSLKITPGGDLWMGTQPRDAPNGKEGWLVKVDRSNGRIIGVIPSDGTHSIEITADEEALTGARPDRVLWFRR